MNASYPRTSRIIRLALIAASAYFFWGVPHALAQGVDEFGPYGRPQDDVNYESPQRWAFELRIGPYYPQVDDEFHGAATPLADTMGSGQRVLFGFEGDWQALRLGKILSFGPGFGMAYTRLSNPATFDYVNHPAPPDVLANGTTSPMDSTLKLWFQWADAVAHVDALNRNFGIPIVFTAKLGLAQALWWAAKGNITSRGVDGSIGHGRSWGPTWALGVMFDLNFAQPERARKLDAVSGINHMYLFAEWYQLKLNGFGNGNQMQVGDSTWTLGYALEF